MQTVPPKLHSLLDSRHWRSGHKEACTAASPRNRYVNTHNEEVGTLVGIEQSMKQTSLGRTLLKQSRVVQNEPTCLVVMEPISWKVRNVKNLQWSSNRHDQCRPSAMHFSSYLSSRMYYYYQETFQIRMKAPIGLVPPENIDMIIKISATSWLGEFPWYRYYWIE